MKPLYDRYRLVKQILCRASSIPVIVSIALAQSSPQSQSALAFPTSVHLFHTRFSFISFVRSLQLL
jgi:hypothetical protein